MGERGRWSDGGAHRSMWFKPASPNSSLCIRRAVFGGELSRLRRQRGFDGREKARYKVWDRNSWW